MENGFIILHRKLLDNPICKNPGVMALWITLLLLVNHKQTKFLWNGKEQILERGQLITGRLKLAQITGIPKSSIRNYLDLLAKLQMLDIKPNNKFSLITIVKYSQYQDNKSKEDSTLDNKRTTRGQQEDTYNNVNNDNNETTLTNVSGNPDKRKPEIKELWEYGVQQGFLTTKQTLNRYAINRLLKGKTVDQLKKAVEFSQQIRDEAYAPQVNNFMDLEEKYLKLRDWVKRQSNNPKKRNVI